MSKDNLPEMSSEEYILLHTEENPKLRRSMAFKRVVGGQITSDIVEYDLVILSELEDNACKRRAISKTDAEWKEIIKGLAQAQYEETYKSTLDTNYKCEVIAQSVHSTTTGRRVFQTSTEVQKLTSVNVEILWRYYFHTLCRLSTTVDQLDEGLKTAWIEWIEAGVNTDFFLPLLDKPSLTHEFFHHLVNLYLAQKRKCEALEMNKSSQP